MKNYLSQYKWWNNPIDNKTQTRYTRFMKVPSGEMNTMFDRISRDFRNRTLGGMPKTRYDDFLEGL